MSICSARTSSRFNANASSTPETLCRTINLFAARRNNGRWRKVRSMRALRTNLTPVTYNRSIYDRQQREDKADKRTCRWIMKKQSCHRGGLPARVSGAVVCPSAMSKHFTVIYTTEMQKINDRHDFFGRWRAGYVRSVSFRDRYSARVTRINLPLEFRKLIGWSLHLKRPANICTFGTRSTLRMTSASRAERSSEPRQRAGRRSHDERRRSYFLCIETPWNIHESSPEYRLPLDCEILNCPFSYGFLSLSFFRSVSLFLFLYPLAPTPCAPTSCPELASTCQSR